MKESRIFENKEQTGRNRPQDLANRSKGTRKLESTRSEPLQRDLKTGEPGANRSKDTREFENTGANRSKRTREFGSVAFGRLPLRAHVLSFLSAFPLQNPPLRSPPLLCPSFFFSSHPVPCPSPAFFSTSLPSSFSSDSVSRSLCHSVCLSVALFLCFSFSSFSHLCFPSSRLVSLRLSFCLFLALARSLSLSLSRSLSVSSFSLCHPLFLSSYFCVYVFQSLRFSVSSSLCFMSLYSCVPSALDPNLVRPIGLFFASLKMLLLLRP